MKRFSTTGMVLAAILFLCVAGASATAGVVVTLDENGNGSITPDGTTFFSMPGVLATDPGPGGGTNVLTYNLLNPPDLIAGDVFLTISGNVDGLIRFNPAGTGDPSYPASLVFYSDDSGGINSLADHDPPGSLYPNFVSIVEGTPYVPSPGDPGYVSTGVTYVILSDVSQTPEPASIALFGSGAIVLAILRKRKSRKA